MIHEFVRPAHLLVQIVGSLLSHWSLQLKTHLYNFNIYTSTGTLTDVPDVEGGNGTASIHALCTLFQSTNLLASNIASTCAEHSGRGCRA